MAGQQAPALWQEANAHFSFRKQTGKTAEKVLLGSVPKAAVEHLSKVCGDCCLQARGVEML